MVTLNKNPDDEPLVYYLQSIIRFCVRVLAIMMTGIIVFGVVDVAYVIYGRLMADPFLLMNISDILATFGAFMAVLIAIEIFINIRLYLGTSVLPIQLVVATALMAIARKVIVLDLDKISPDYIYAIAAVSLALGISYWLIAKKT